MKKALTRTIIVFVALNLITVGFAFAQNAPDEGIRDTIAAQAAEEADFAQKQMEAAQKEAEVAQKQMEVAQKEMETQEKKLQAQLKQLLAEQTQAKISPATRQAITSYEMIGEPPMATPVAPRLSLPVVWPRSGSGAVLVIPTAEMKVENLVAITEDMTVMSRIFDTKLSQAHLTTGRGGWFVGLDLGPLFGRDSRTTEAIYLEGYGALFLMKVNVLLSAPPETQQEKETKEEDIDPLWAETRRQMYEPEKVSRTRRTDRPEEKYDAEKVEDLKETLIKTLKHAANIRGLKPDESVILTVTGSGVSSNVDKIVMNKSNQLLVHTKDRNIVQILGSPSLSDLGISSPTVLTIRAKKADIDAFANGTLSFNQFSQKILLLSYSYLGGNISGGPSRSFPTNIVY